MKEEEDESFAEETSDTRRVQFSEENETQLISHVSSERLISTKSRSLTWFEVNVSRQTIFILDVPKITLGLSKQVPTLIFLTRLPFKRNKMDTSHL